MSFQSKYSVTDRCKCARRLSSRTNEEDGEGDEEQKDMRNQVKSVHKAAVVQHAVLHAVGTVLVAAERQGHVIARLLHALLGSIWEDKTHGETRRGSAQTKTPTSANINRKQPFGPSAVLWLQLQRLHQAFSWHVTHFSPRTRTEAGSVSGARAISGAVPRDLTPDSC